MPPAPARIASAPRQSSRTCWNPAVPPPPVLGAAAGIEVSDGLGAGGLGLGVVALGVAALGVAAFGVLAPGVLALGVLPEAGALGVPLAEPVGVAGLDPPAGNEGGVVGVEPEQADTDAVASTAKAAQPRTVPRRRRRP
jgi:hypothetical protein